MVTPSALNWLTVAFMVIIFGFIWRTLAAKWADRPVGQAMATIF
jgi:hypothetical protein